MQGRILSVENDINTQLVKAMVDFSGTTKTNLYVIQWYTSSKTFPIRSTSSICAPCGEISILLLTFAGPIIFFGSTYIFLFLSFSFYAVGHLQAEKRASYAGATVYYSF